MGKDKLEWIPESHGKKSKSAIKAGEDSGKKLYVIRANHEGGVIPGKLHKGHTHAYIAYNGAEVPKEEYEVLSGPKKRIQWEHCSGTNIPSDAIPGGKDPNGDTLYIGRVSHSGTLTIGKVHPSHGTCYIAYDGSEHGHADYEILVEK